MHVESPLPGNIWNPNLMLGEPTHPLGPSAMRFGNDAFRTPYPPPPEPAPHHPTNPQTKIKCKLVAAVTKTGTLSRARHVALCTYRAGKKRQRRPEKTF